MSTTQSIANTIRDLAAAQAQIAIQRGNVNAGMIQGLAQIPANVYGMKRDIENQNLRRDSLRRAGEIQDITLNRAKKEEQDEKELEAILKSLPPDPAVRLNAFIEFWDQRDPSKAAEVRGALQNEAMTMAKLKEGQPGQFVPAPNDPATGWPTDVEARGSEQPHAPIQVPSRFGGEGVTLQPHTESELMRKALMLKDAESRIRREENTYNMPGIGEVPKNAVPSIITSRSAENRNQSTLESNATQKELDRQNKLEAERIRAASRGKRGGAGGAGTVKEITPTQLNSILSRMNNQLHAVRSKYSLPSEAAGMEAQGRGQGMGMLRAEEERIKQAASDSLASFGLTLEDALARQGKGSPRGGGAAARGITATGPNGDKLELVNGQWVPVR